jgi:hypothetical protein
MTEAYQKLRTRIADKQRSLSQHEALMKEQFADIKEHLSPRNLIKGAVKSVVRVGTTPTALQTGITIGAGFLADRFLFRKKNVIVRSLGLFAVRKLVNKFTTKLSRPETS